MMRKTILLAVGAIALMAFQSFAQYNHEYLKIKRSSEHTVEPNSASEEIEQFDMSFSFENLRLYPIIANDKFKEEHKDIGKFTLLKDAIGDGKIVITETGATHMADGLQNERTIENDSTAQNNQQFNVQQVNNEASFGGGVSGTVNTLYAQNNSLDTIFIMAGEVVKGGKQDRVIGQDIVMAPGQKMNLSAFCVEQNRWTTKEGNEGVFTGYYNITNMDIRKTVATDNNQSEVWRKVGEQTSKNGASSATSTYTNLANSAEYQEKLKKYMEVFKSAFENDSNIIGVIVVTGDKVMGCDMFATHDLFINSYESLLHSYIGEAVTNGSEVSISNEEVFAYLDKILKNEEQQKEQIEKNGLLYEWNNKKIHISTY